MKPIIIGSLVPSGVAGEGKAGPQGPPGQAAAITVNPVITGAAGTKASVAQTGTAQNRILTFTIPRGDPGEIELGAPVTGIPDGKVLAVIGGELVGVDTSYTYTFSRKAAGTTWNINHKLNQKYVLVQVVDDGGNEVICRKEFVDENHVTLHFDNPVSGMAVIRR